MIASILCNCYDYMEMVTKIKLQIKQAPAFPLFMFAYSYRLFKKFNKASLNYSLKALFRLPGGGYTHAALETFRIN